MVTIQLVTQLTPETVAAMAALQEFLLKGKHGRPLDERLFRDCIDTGFLVGAWKEYCGDVPGEGTIYEHQLVGMCYVFIHQTLSRRVMLYEELVVAPAARGQGVADKIDQFLVSLARTHACDCIEGVMPIDNMPVQTVHKRNGFVVRAQLPFRLTLNNF